MISDNVKKGMGRAPNRSLFYALGLTQEELERPLVGIVSSHNEIVPGPMTIDTVVEAVRERVPLGVYKFKAYLNGEPDAKGLPAAECLVKCMLGDGGRRHGA